MPNLGDHWKGLVKKIHTDIRNIQPQEARGVPSSKYSKDKQRGTLQGPI